MLIHPQFDPIALHLGPIAVRWYGLSYIVGLMLALQWVKKLAARHRHAILTPQLYDDFFGWAVLGVILGGRLGYVFFYNPTHYLANPAEILYVWQGGMSFHGGAWGVILAMLLYSFKHKVNPVDFADRITPAVPIGLFFGRIANFINAELWGKPAGIDCNSIESQTALIIGQINCAPPWAMVFPNVDNLPRHPSQLYEAALEGALLFAILWWVTRKPFTRGVPSGLFLVGYGCARMFAEVYRTPEIIHDMGTFYISHGQALNLPLMLFGFALLLNVARK